VFAWFLRSISSHHKDTGPSTTSEVEMNRKDFGLWGLELDPSDFARALAALGVFQGSNERRPSSLSVETIKQSLTKAALQSNGLLRWQIGRASCRERV